MKHLTKELNFLQAYIPTGFKGIAIAKNPKKGFFQNLSLLFNKKAFDTEISYFILGKDEIKIIRFLEGNLVDSHEIAANSIQKIYVSKGITEDGLIKTLQVEMTVAFNEKKSLTHFYTLMPAFLGNKTEKIYSSPSLEEAKSLFSDLEEELKSIVV